MPFVSTRQQLESLKCVGGAFAWLLLWFYRPVKVYKIKSHRVVSQLKVEFSYICWSRLDFSRDWCTYIIQVFCGNIIGVWLFHSYQIRQLEGTYTGEERMETSFWFTLIRTIKCMWHAGFPAERNSRTNKDEMREMSHSSSISALIVLLRNGHFWYPFFFLQFVQKAERENVSKWHVVLEHGPTLNTNRC